MKGVKYVYSFILLALSFNKAYTSKVSEDLCLNVNNRNVISTDEVVPCKREETCTFPAEERRDCGFPGIGTEECLNRGCCHNATTLSHPTSHTNSVPWCFYSQIESCSFAWEERRDCGYSGITSEQCLQRGCCHNSTIDGTLAPHCFFSQIDACEIPAYERRDCGYSGISVEECEAKGCCHSPSSGAASCFPKLMDPATEFNSNGNEGHDIYIWTHRNSFSFTLKSCGVGNIRLLYDWYEDIGLTYYQFILGADGVATKVRFMKYVSGSEAFSQDYDSGETVVNCSSPISFEIQWLSGNVWLIKGGHVELVSYEDSELITVNEVGIWTTGDTGLWVFNNNMGRVMTVAVTAENHGEEGHVPYTLVWAELAPQKTDLVLSVSATESVYLLLTENVGRLDYKAYEVALGIEANQKSYVRDMESNDLQDILTPGILVGDFRSFWVSWKDGNLLVGYGEVVGADQLMGKVFPQANIRFASLAHTQGDGGMAYVSFAQNKDPLYYTTTPVDTGEDWQYRSHFNTYSTHMLFTVHTCSSARVYLATDTVKYRFIVSIGAAENTEISIKVQDGPVRARTIHGLLSCSESRMFWINWIESTLSVGRGSRLNEHELLTYHDSTRTNDITGIAFRSTEYAAEWTIAKSLVYQVILQPTHDSYTYNDWADLGGAREAQVTVRACSDVHFLFSRYAGLLNGPVEVVLGVWANTVNMIRDGHKGTLLASYNKTGVLDCNRHHSVWFTWGDDHFRVGISDVIGADEIMNVHPDQITHEYSTIGSLGMGSNSPSASQPPTFQMYSSARDTAYTYFSKQDNSRALQFMTYRTYFVFSVRACSDVRLILSRDPDVLITNAYELRIGSDANSQIQLYRDGQMVKNTLNEAPLSCSDMRFFWLTWADKQIHFGYGNVINSNNKLSYEDLHHFITGLHALKLESYDTKDARWHINKDQALSARVTTPARKTYNNIWLNVEKENSIVFSVQATNVSYVALAALMGTPGVFEAVEIQLSSEQSYIAFVVQHITTQLVTVNTTDLLSSTEHRYFWVSWSTGMMEVGTGTIVGLNVFMRFDFVTPEHYASLALSSGKDVGQAQWVISSAEETFLQLKTGALYYEGVSYRHTTQQLTFKVKACRDAHIAMFQENKEMAYEFIIGGDSNSRSYILRDSESYAPPEQDFSTPDILHCYEPRTFTLNWGAGGISLIDDLGSFYISWTDPNPIPVQYLSFATGGVIGHWFFHRHSGDKFTVTTYDGERMKVNNKETDNDNSITPDVSNIMSDEAPDGYFIPGEYKYSTLWMAAAEQKSFRFRVRACAEAHVILSTFFGIADYESFEIRIGELQDSFVSIYVSRVLECNKKEMSVLECSGYKDFWITWNNDIIQVGEGTILGQQPITFCHSTGLDISGVAVATDKGNDGEWILEDYRGNEIMSFWTPADYPDWTFNRAWMVPRQDWITFEVETSEWVVVMLCDQPWITDTKCHEVTIGYQEHSNPNSQVSYITDVDYPESPKVSTTTPNCLTGGSLNAFWISWEDRKIRVGFGYGKDSGSTVLSLSEGIQHDVNGVAFATPKHNSLWQIPRDLARQMHLRYAETSAITETDKIEVSITGLTSVVFQVIGIDKVTVSLVRFGEGINEVAFTLLIGSDDNRYSALYDEMGSMLDFKETPDILNAVLPQTYWIAWTSHSIQFGRGGMIGQDVVLSHETSVPQLQNAFFSSIARSEFIFVELSGLTYNIYTDTDWGYDVAWLEVSHTEVHLRVRGCADAHVLLAQELRVVEENKVYEIVFGGSGNSVLYLRKGPLTSDLISAQVNNMLDCNAFRRFWISWDDNMIRIGSGYRDQGHVYLEYHDEDEFIPISYAALSSGFGSEADWEFQHGLSEGIIVYTPAEETYEFSNVYITVQGQQYVTFQVKACSNAQVALSAVPNAIMFDTHQIRIGYEDNGKGIIFDFADGTFNSYITSETLLDCNMYKTFWINWAANGMNNIILGKGDKVGGSILVDIPVSNNNRFMINGISFRTGSSNVGEFRYLSSGVNADSSASTLSGGAVFGIIVGVLAIVAIIALIVGMVFIPAARIKAQQVYITVKDKFTPINESGRVVDPSIIASQVGFESSA